MKKLMIPALCLLLCLTAPAMALTLEDWNDTCDSRMAASASVWNTPTEASNGVAPQLMLPKGTLVKLNGSDGTWSYVDYYAGGQVHSGVVGWACVAPINGMDPTPTPIPTPTIEPIHTVAPTPEPTPTPAGLSVLVPAETPAAVTPVPSGAANVLTAEVALEDGSVVDAEVVSLGTVTSVVRVTGQSYEVPTSDVSCELALVSAPKTGKATMRVSPEGGAKSLGNVSHGTVIAVLERGETFSKVWSDGKAYYLLTSCLNSEVAVASPLGKGTICTSKGKTTGKTGITVRVSASKKGTKMAEWKVGTEVTVLQLQDGFYEAELNGVRGFIAENNVKLGE